MQGKSDAWNVNVDGDSTVRRGERVEASLPLPPSYQRREIRPC